MHESFGALLRQRREERAIPLVTIADQTKIKLSLLEELERDDVSRWPSGIFRRAFVRSYAHAIGLDPDVVVREFLERYPDPEVVETPLAAAASEAGVPQAPRSRLRDIVGSALDSLSRLRGSTPGEDQVAGSSALPAHAPAADVVAAPPGSPPPQPATVVSSVTPERSAPQSPNGAPYARPPHGRSPAPAAAPPATLAPAAAAAERLAPPAPPGTAVLQRSERPIDFVAVAHLCTELGRVETAEGLQRLLQEAATILDAKGLIVWVWDDAAAGLRPALAHGYPDRALAQLPVVTRDADNATAAAFRSGLTSVIEGRDEANGALVTPLLTAAGCAGVLALELPHGREQAAPVRAAATIFAALLSQLIGAPESVEVRPEVHRTAAPAEAVTGRSD